MRQAREGRLRLLTGDYLGATDPVALRRLLDLQLAYWKKLFEVTEGIPIDVVETSDYLAGQHRMLISPASYREILKPLHRELFDYIHSRTRAKIFFHTCGAVHAVIPDLIDVGVDILNPVQVSAKGMDSAELKREYGRDLTFWGGGVDTQRTLPFGTPQQVRDQVRQSLEAFSPGGGYVFAAVHNIGPLIAVGVTGGALLPKSGHWMKAVKKFFGFMLLGLAIWIVAPVIPAALHMLAWAALLIIGAMYLHALDPLPEHASGYARFWKGVGVIALLVGVALVIGTLSGSRDVLQPLAGLRVAALGEEAHERRVDTPARQHQRVHGQQEDVGDLDRDVADAVHRQVDGQLLQFLEHDTLAYECFGFLVETFDAGGLAHRVVQGTNLNTERTDRFQMDPQEFVRVEKDADAEELSIIGFYHSHPDWPAIPSQTDIAWAWEGSYYLIVSLHEGRPFNTGVWLLAEDEPKRFIQTPLEIMAESVLTTPAT